MYIYLLYWLNFFKLLCITKFFQFSNKNTNTKIYENNFSNVVSKLWWSNYIHKFQSFEIRVLHSFDWKHFLFWRVVVRSITYNRERVCEWFTRVIEWIFCQNLICTRRFSFTEIINVGMYHSNGFYCCDCQPCVLYYHTITATEKTYHRYNNIYQWEYIIRSANDFMRSIKIIIIIIGIRRFELFTIKIVKITDCLIRWVFWIKMNGVILSLVNSD